MFQYWSFKLEMVDRWDFFPEIKVPETPQSGNPVVETEITNKFPELRDTGFRVFLKIARLWDLDETQQTTLLAATAEEFSAWKIGNTSGISGGTLVRISYILTIYRCLQVLFDVGETTGENNRIAADRWIKEPNTASIYGGASALNRILSDGLAGLEETTRYLQNECGPGNW